MAKRLPEESGATGATLLDFIASKEFRDGDFGALAVKMGYKPGRLERSCEQPLRTGDWLPAIEYYVAHQQDIPQWLGKMIVKSRKAKPKMGRPAEPQKQLIYFLAVRHLMIDEGMKQTKAEEKAGAALHVSRECVHEAYILLRDKYASMRCIKSK
jgi:hypothetical protein